MAVGDQTSRRGGSRSLKGQGPNWLLTNERPRYLSRALTALWAKTDKKLVEGYVGPVDFDVVADTNDLTLTGFSLKLETRSKLKATVAATIAYAKPRGPTPPSCDTTSSTKTAAGKSTKFEPTSIRFAECSDNS
jgi:hypothetical protein